MGRKLQITALLTLIALIIGCDNQRVNRSISDAGRSIVPQAGESIPLAAETPFSAPVAEPEAQPQVRVRLPPEYSPAQVIDLNLDLTDTEEQVVVFKRRDDELDLIRILVLSFDPVRNSWIRAWEGETGANSVRSFTLYTDDLIGDHELELVCFGINNAGEQTLDVFRRTSSALGLGLAYESIAALTADVSIQIQQRERSEAYENLQATSGISYPIEVRRRDPDSEDVLDYVSTTYLWRFELGRYVQSETVRIPGEQVEDAQLREIFGGGVSAFERFLSGPWFRLDQGEQRLLHFDLRERSVVFHSGHLQNVFDWDDSVKAVYGRDLQLIVSNAGIESHIERLVIRAESLSRIRLSAPESGDLSGVYERLSDELQSSIAASRRASARLASLELLGAYRGDEGVELAFSEPEFTMRGTQPSGSGGFVIFELSGDTVLELQFLDVNRLPTETRSFRVSYEEEIGSGRIVRTIELEPGSVGIDGFIPSGAPRLSLEQIEQLEQSAE